MMKLENKEKDIMKELEVTDSSFQKEHLVDLLPENSKRAIATKSLTMQYMTL